MLMEIARKNAFDQ
jgi:hypothetical protein